MRLKKLLRKPLVLVPLSVGILLPCLIVITWHLSRRAAASSELILKGAVVISVQPLPKTQLLQLNGNTVPPQALRSGKVLLVFMTTNCPACQKELKLISNITPELAGNIQTYGVAFQDPKEVSKFVEQNGIVTAILHDKNAELVQLLGVKYFPTKFLVQDGIIVKTWFGNSLNKADLISKVGL